MGKTHPCSWNTCVKDLMTEQKILWYWDCRWKQSASTHLFEIDVKENNTIVIFFHFKKHFLSLPIFQVWKDYHLFTFLLELLQFSWGELDFITSLSAQSSYVLHPLKNAQGLLTWSSGQRHNYVSDLNSLALGSAQHQALPLLS